MSGANPTLAATGSLSSWTGNSCPTSGDAGGTGVKHPYPPIAVLKSLAAARSLPGLEHPRHGAALSGGDAQAVLRLDVDLGLDVPGTVRRGEPPGSVLVRLDLVVVGVHGPQLGHVDGERLALGRRPVARPHLPG